MATFTELCDDVFTITNRPDLIAETKLAVKAATLKAHQIDYFAKDIRESGIKFPTSDYYQQLQLRTLFPTFRAIKYLRRWDNSGSGRAAEFLEITTPLETVDDYGVDKVNIAYLSGDNLSIKAYAPIEYAIVGVYLNPTIVESDYSSWIALDHPFVIVYEAARLVYKQIGFDEQASAFEKLVAEQVALLRIANVQSVGY